MTADPLVMRPELRELVGGVSSETIRRWMLSGRLPQPDFQPTHKTMGWRRSTLEAAGLVERQASPPASE